MKTRVLFILFGLFLMAAAVSAQDVTVGCSATPVESGMLQLGTPFTTIVYYADMGGLTPVQTNIVISGYWRNADNYALYCAHVSGDPSTIFIFNRGDVPNG